MLEGGEKGRRSRYSFGIDINPEESTTMQATALLEWLGLAIAICCSSMSPSVEEDDAWLEGKEASSTVSGRKYHCSQQNALARGQMGPAQLLPQ